MLFIKAFGVWLLILACAMLNGALREFILLPAFEKPVAFVVSGLLLSALIVLVALVFIPRMGRLGPLQAIHIGAFWLALTLAFEFGFGRLVQHRSWADLLEAYTFSDGNIWPFVLLVTLFSPLIAARLRS